MRGEARRHCLLQALCLAALSSAFVVPFLLRVGTNIVTKTYDVSAARLWAGISPYLPPEGGGDWHKCSPFFSFLYTPFGLLPEAPQAILWAITNAFLFWLGVSRWCRLDRKSPWWIWAGIAAASMELDGSLRYQQTNALLIGLSLIALADFRDGLFLRSGFLLAIATNLKILPAVFAVPLLFPPRPRYVKGIGLAVLVALTAPALAAGIANTWHFHLDWAGLLLGDLGKPGLLDIESVLGRLGAGATIAKATRLAVLVVSLPVIFLRRGDWLLWIPFAAYTVLLTSPRTESPTFVLAGPAYVLLLCHFGALDQGPARRLGLSLLAAGFFLVTFSFNDLWPKALWNPLELRYSTKTLGIMLLWALTGAFLLRRGQPAHRFFR